MLHTVIYGVNGKMGLIVTKMVQDHKDFDIVAGVDHSPMKVAHSFPVYQSPFDIQGEVDVIIDFSHPSHLETMLAFAKRKKAALVIGTTGYTNEQIDKITISGTDIPILRASNMSIGISIINHLLKNYAKLLGALFDIEIIEKHHSKKLDAPSGTAYLLANTINQALENSKSYVFGRYGGRTRQEDQIGIHAIRGGTLVGEHTVLFAGKDEVIEITHQAHSREIYAHGAILAAQTIAHKPPGIYSIDDIISSHLGKE